MPLGQGRVDPGGRLPVRESHQRFGGEVLPEDQLSPARSRVMRLDPQWVTTVAVDSHAVAFK